MQATANPEYAPVAPHKYWSNFWDRLIRPDVRYNNITPKHISLQWVYSNLVLLSVDINIRKGKRARYDLCVESMSQWNGSVRESQNLAVANSKQLESPEMCVLLLRVFIQSQSVAWWFHCSLKTSRIQNFCFLLLSLSLSFLWVLLCVVLCVMCADIFGVLHCASSLASTV